MALHANRMSMKIRCFLFLLFLLPLMLPAQELKRRGFFGVQVQPAGGDGGVRVAAVVPNSTAAALAVQPGDIITALNGQTVTGVSQFLGALSGFHENDAVRIQLQRENATHMVEGRLMGFPPETDPVHELHYGVVRLKGGGLARSILKMPKGIRRPPVVFFMQGFHCGSIDNLPTTDPQRRLMDGLVEKGYAVFRMEKPGTGDAAGVPPCADIDYQTEKEAFLAGLRALKSDARIDRDQVFLFGHSLGATTAPLIAVEEPVKGIIGYGFTHKPWLEYLTDLYPNQMPLYGMDSATVQKNMKDYVALLREFFIGKRSPAALAANEAYRPYLSALFQYDGGEKFFGRHFTFMQQLQDIPIREAWVKSGAHVLAIYGSADIQALDASSVEAVAAAINNLHPGRARALVLPGTDHGFIKVGTKREAIRLQAQNAYGDFARDHFNTELVEIIDDWIRKIKKEA